MTQIDFYTHVDDKMRVASRLSAKAVARGMRVVVYCADPEAANRLDRMLWTTPSTGFVPHCAADDPLAPETPVIIDCRGENLVHDEVLVNLRDEQPPFFSRFQRLVEIVSRDDADRASARERFRFYRDRGYEIRTHDLSRTRDA